MIFLSFSVCAVILRGRRSSVEVTPDRCETTSSHLDFRLEDDSVGQKSSSRQLASAIAFKKRIFWMTSVFVRKTWYGAYMKFRILGIPRKILRNDKTQILHRV